MSKDAATKAEPTVDHKPTVSVAEAMGLPDDWSLAGALKNAKPEDDPTKLKQHVDDDEVPAGADEDDDDKEKSEEKPEGKKEEKSVAKKSDKKEEKSVPAKKDDKKSEKPAAKTKEKTAEKSDEDDDSEEKPAEKKVEKPAKIKLGDKEYTPEELQEAVKKAGEKPAVAAPPEEKKAPTKEEIDAQKIESKKKDDEWVGTTAKLLDAPIDEATLDKILTGGAEGMAALQQLRQTDMARAILVARKSMFQDLQPILDDLRARQEPLIDTHAQAADEREWNNFVTTYPKFANRREAVESVVSALCEKEGERVSKLSMADFQAEVATRTEKVLKSFGVNLDEAPAEKTEEKPGEKSDDKKEEKPAEKKEERAKVKPPGANAPTPTAGKGGKGKSGDSDIIQTLW